MARLTLMVILLGCLLWGVNTARGCRDRSSSCSKLRSKPSLCYSAYNRDLCCTTCQSLNTGIAGCEYGDKTNCSGLTYPFGCYGNEDVCCGSCKKYKDSTKPDCQFGDKSAQCADAVASDPYICDVGNNSDICCGSCGIGATGTGTGTVSGTNTVTIDSSMKHSIETRVVVDKFAYARWKKTVNPSLTEAEKNAQTERLLGIYIKAVVQGVNTIFGGLMSAGINIDVRVANVVYVSTETVASEILPGSGTGEVDSMLTKLKTWLDAKNYPRVDHTVLFTGLDVADDTGNFKVLGAAQLGAICTSQSLSVVESVFNGNTILTFAHEMGHSLSCKHDGDGNSCSVGSKYVMDASKDHNDTNNFRFSECSFGYIKEKLQALYSSSAGNCLAAANTNTVAVTSEPLGKVYTPDEMCRLTVGEGSYVCRTLYGSGGDTDYSTMCAAMWCATADGSNRCVSVVGADGVPCGKDKECSLGYCKASGATNSLTDTCPLGDIPSYAKVPFANKTCSDLVTSSYAGACYDGYYNRACCVRCNDFKTSIAGCQFGDKSTWCKDPSRNYPYTCYYNEDLCCSTCATYKDTSLPAGCEYGDRATGCNPLWHCPTYADSECCATCAGKK